jgi:Ni/Co efflux regulator RcnB
MKRLLLTAAASLMLAGSLSAPAMAQQPYQYQRGDNRNDNDRGRYDNDRNDRHGNRDWRDNRRDARWDNGRHNGYWLGRTWHYGPPPASAYRTRDFQLGYKQWRKGDRLGYYNTRYVEVDYRAHHLRPPPRGYHYVQDDRGDIILAVIATGLIASIIANS